jgi:hypothetical protein
MERFGTGVMVRSLQDPDKQMCIPLRNIPETLEMLLSKREQFGTELNAALALGDGSYSPELVEFIEDRSSTVARVDQELQVVSKVAVPLIMDGIVGLDDIAARFGW